jgi:ribonuclease D
MANMRASGTEIIVREGDLPDEPLSRMRNAGIVAWDIETSGLDWRTERIATCQLYSPGGTVEVVKVGAYPPENLSLLLADAAVTKIFHHAMFDLRFMHQSWQVMPNNIACSKIASKLLTPREEHAHSLKSLVEQHLGVVLDKTEQRSDWLSAKLTDEQLLYAASDVLYLIPLLKTLEDALQQRDLLNLARACYQHVPTRVRLDVLGYEDVYTY